MTSNSKIYLEEVQKISANWEKQFYSLVQRSQQFLQLNAIVFSVIFFQVISITPVFDLNYFNSLLFFAISSLSSLIILLPPLVKEITIEIKNWDELKENDNDTIYNDLIHQYQKKIKSYKTTCKIYTLLMSLSVISFFMGFIILGLEFIRYFD